MDYGNPKTLPVTGGIFFASTLAGQLWVLAAIFLAVTLAAYAIRIFWRRKKLLNER